MSEDNKILRGPVVSPLGGGLLLTLGVLCPVCRRPPQTVITQVMKATVALLKDPDHVLLIEQCATPGCKDPGTGAPPRYAVTGMAFLTAG